MENRVYTKKEKQNKICFWGLVCISFVAVWIYNTLTPLMSDDLMFDKSLYHSIGDVFYQEYLQYFNWTGRSVLQICLKFSSLMPKSLFNILNSFMFVALSLLIYANIRGKKKKDVFLYLTIQLFLWLGAVDFGQTILWLGGACNYLWGIVFILFFITLFRNVLKFGEKITWRRALLLLCISVMAGWGNENTSGGAILIALLFWGYDYYEKKVWNKNALWGIAGSCIGFAFLIFSPSNKVRAGLMASEETYTGIAAYISRGLKIIQVYKDYFFLYLACILFLFIFLYQKKLPWRQLVSPAIFTISGLATGAVLLFTPQPMNRAYFGTGIFFIIAVIQLIWLLPGVLHKDFFIVRNAWILAGALWLIFVYIENGANLTRILREVKEREQFVAEELERDWKDVVLPQLRPEFKNPYTYIYENDIEEDTHWWMNEVYCRYYGLDTITAVERELWDKSH
ncbi:MAG: DUF6056 family protein [Lachnospiraceae bacterium]|nr:DUF6056 family protein [Lachnospiraceae bacterium]